ncbi:MAG: hypothetical protein RLN95_09275 [Nitratireductor sp.]
MNVTHKMTLAQAQADTPISDPEFYQLAFYDASYISNSGAIYRKQASKPAHDGNFENGNNTWYALYERVVTPQMFGARADGVSGTDGAITASDTTFTSASAAFKSADVGKMVNVEGAGAAGAQLSTTIASINSATSIELADAASATVSMATFACGTDDKDAFKSLANVIEHGAAKKVRIPAGSYLCNFTSEPGDRFDINNTDGWSIDGDGISVTRIIQCGTSGRPFTLRNSNNIAFRGIELFMTYEGGAADNLDIMNCNQATIEKNRFMNSTFYGLGAFQDTFDAIDGTINDFTVRFNEFEGCGIFGFEHFPKLRSSGLRCHDNVFRNCGRNHISLENQDPAAMKPGQATENSRIYSNVIYGAAGAGGIWMGNYEDIECYDNELYDVPDIAIALNAATHPYPYSGGFRSAIIRNNLLKTSSDFSRSEASLSVSASVSAVSTMGPVVISGNKVIGDTTTYSLRVQTIGAIPKLQIIDNYWENSREIFVPILLHDASGAAPFRPLVKGNRFINRNLSATVFRVELSGSESPVREGNDFANAGRNAITLALCTGIISIRDNIIDGYNVDNTAGVAAININDNVSNEYYVSGNWVLTGQVNPKAVCNGTHSTPTVYLEGNLTDDVAVLQVLNSIPTVYAGGARPFASYGRNRHFYGTAAPVSGGSYARGDIVWNTVPSASGTIGWVCTASGNPGTWKTFGTIAP